jgi:hypothetical protein
MADYNISGDSGEYEFLTEAVQMSANIEGMCVEIGLRRGMGTKTIIDAVRQYCPDKTVIAVDPYGSILYQGREHMEPCRLDYTNQMKNECLAAIYTYLVDHPCSFQFYNWTDDRFFLRMEHGVPTYELEEKLITKYSMVHLDGPHSVAAISHEIKWFSAQMDSGATLCVDDITPDFVQIEPIQELFIKLGWEEVKLGLKKGIWKKC